jgi:fatty-acyl-CoA synthase
MFPNSSNPIRKGTGISMQTHDRLNLTLGQILDRAVTAHPDNEAIIYVDRDFRLTYREFSQTVDRLARGLMALGVQKGEKVAVWATNIPYWVALQFATAKIGAILITVNTNYKSAELAYLLKQSETENRRLPGHGLHQYRL